MLICRGDCKSNPCYWFLHFTQWNVEVLAPLLQMSRDEYISNKTHTVSDILISNVRGLLDCCIYFNTMAYKHHVLLRCNFCIMPVSKLWAESPATYDYWFKMTFFSQMTTGRQYFWHVLGEIQFLQFLQHSAFLE